MPIVDLVTILARECLDIVNLADFVWIQIVEPRNYVSAAARQPRIYWCREAERAIVGSVGCQVINHCEVLVPASEEANVHGHHWHEFMLNANGVLPVGQPFAPSSN